MEFPIVYKLNYKDFYQDVDALGLKFFSLLYYFDKYHVWRHSYVDNNYYFEDGQEIDSFLQTSRDY